MISLFDRALEAHIAHEAEQARIRREEEALREEALRQMRNEAREQTRAFVAKTLAPDVEVGKVTVWTSVSLPIRVTQTKFSLEGREFVCYFGFEARTLRFWVNHLYLVTSNGKEQPLIDLRTLGALLAKETEPSPVAKTDSSPPGPA